MGSVYAHFTEEATVSRRQGTCHSPEGSIQDFAPPGCLERGLRPALRPAQLQTGVQTRRPWTGNRTGWSMTSVKPVNLLPLQGTGHHASPTLPRPGRYSFSFDDFPYSSFKAAEPTTSTHCHL